jgi:hypothetical protein
LADTPISNAVVTNGTTAVTLLAAPGANIQRIIPGGASSVFNKDTVQHDYTWRKTKGATVYSIFKAAGVQPNQMAMCPKKVILGATDESFTMVVDALATVTESDCDIAAIEAS